MHKLALSQLLRGKFLKGKESILPSKEFLENALSGDVEGPLDEN